MPPAPSATTSTPACAPQPTRSRGEVYRHCAAPSDGPWTRASSNTRVRSYSPGTPNHSGTPALPCASPLLPRPPGFLFRQPRWVGWPRLHRRSGRHGHGTPSMICWCCSPPGRRRSPPSRRWIARDCGAASSQSGVRSGIFRRAILSTSGPLTVTWPKPFRGQALSRPGCHVLIFSYSAPCCTTLVRAAGRTTAWSALNLRSGSGIGWDCGRLTSGSWPAWFATICSFPRRQQRATSPTPRPPPVSLRHSSVIRCCWSCWPP